INKDDGKAPTVYQYREEAPKSGGLPETFAIPGFVKGMEKINSDLGTMSMAELIEPSIKMAVEGFPINNNLASRFERGASRMNVPEMPDYFPENRLLEANEELVQPELAETLTKIKNEGSKGFYEGEVAEGLLDFVPEIEPSDLTNFEVEIKEPAHGKFAGYDVYSAPPPLAGVTLIQMLQMAELADIDDLENPVDYIHLFGEISKRAYADRLDNIGDPKLSPEIDANRVTTADYSKRLIENFNPKEVSKNYKINDSISDEEDHDNTTHFVVVDKDNMMVSATHTLGNFFGSGDYVAGFFLNNQIDNYSLTNDSPNFLEPGKVSRSFT